MTKSLGIGKRLRDWRKRNGMNQTELANKINTSGGYISQIENDDRVPGSEILVSLLHEFPETINIRWLLLGEEKSDGTFSCGEPRAGYSHIPGVLTGGQRVEIDKVITLSDYLQKLEECAELKAQCAALKTEVKMLREQMQKSKDV